MRLIDADKVYPWYLKAFSAEKIGKEREIKPYEVRFSMNDIRENLSNIPTEQEPSEDCISREWIKTALHNFYYGQENMPTEEDIQAYLDAAPSVRPKPGWIPATCPPKENGRYLVTIHYSTHDTTRIVSYTKNLYEVNEYDFAGRKRPGWYSYDSEYGFFERDNVVAWMPLPKEYPESEGKEF